MALGIGDVLDGKYRVLRLIGEGGMGAVYEGENTLIRRRVAIKALLSSVANGAEVVQRFEREAQAAGQIGNDHILEVLDLGRLPTGGHYMVMEYLDGETLAQRILARGRLSCIEVATIVRQALIGLGAAHAAGIIHRDMKPDNIFILREKAGRPDFVKLIDFGISKFSDGPESHRMTRAGALLGTPCYMSPEQARGLGDADARTDLYALGVIMYEASSGQLPFDGPSFNDLLFKIVLEPARPLEQLAPHIDAEFASIVMRAMAKEPDQRFQSTEEFARALDGWMQGRVGPAGPELTMAGGFAAPLIQYPQRTPQPNRQPTPVRSGTPNPNPSQGDDSFAHGRTWAATPSQQPPKKSKLALIAGAGLVGLAAVGVLVAALAAKGRSHPTPRGAALVASGAASGAGSAAGAATAPITEPALSATPDGPQTIAPVASASAVASAAASVSRPKQPATPRTRPNAAPNSGKKPGVPDFGY